MTEKRFENRLDKSNVKFNTLNPVWDNEKEDALNVFEMIDELNRLNSDCFNLIDDNTEFNREINQIYKENEQIKYRIQKYYDTTNDDGKQILSDLVDSFELDKINTNWFDKGDV